MLRKIALTGLATAVIVTGGLASAAPAFADNLDTLYFSAASDHLRTIEGFGLSEGAAAMASHNALREVEDNCVIQGTVVEKVPAKNEFRSVITAFCSGQETSFRKRHFSGDTLQDAIDNFVGSSKSQGCTPVSMTWKTDVDEDGVFGFGTELCPRR